MLPEPPVLPPIVPESPAIERVLSEPIQRAAVPPARPGHIAEREELDAALAKGTRAALELFIRRHPNSRYRAEAEERLRAIGE